MPVTKRSVSLPDDILKAVEAEALADGIGVSTAITQAARSWLVVRRGLREVAAWEAEHGALRADELAAADTELDAVLRQSWV